MDNISIIIGFIIIPLVITIAFIIGKKFSLIQFENKGHEEVEKHLIKQSKQLQDITDRYSKLRDRIRRMQSLQSKDDSDNASIETESS